MTSSAPEAASCSVTSTANGADGHADDTDLGAVYLHGSHVVVVAGPPGVTAFVREGQRSALASRALVRGSENRASLLPLQGPTVSR